MGIIAGAPSISFEPIPVKDALGLIATFAFGLIAVYQTAAKNRADAKNQRQQSELQNAQTARERLEGERREQSQQFAILLKERESISKDNDNLRGNLRDEIDRLKDDLKDVRAEAEDWQRKYENERSEKSALFTKYEQLQSDHNELKRRLDNMEQKVETIAAPK